jgi:leader peptidase (prepilin peptidase)/N-methyltransferase
VVVCLFFFFFLFFFVFFVVFFFVFFVFFVFFFFFVVFFFGVFVVGVFCLLAVRGLQGTQSPAVGLMRSLIGMAVGAGIVYLVLRAGKLLFGKQNIELPPDTRIIFTETGVVLPDQEILFEDLFYRKSDAILIEAKSVEIIDRCYRNVRVRLMPDKLHVGDESFDPETVPQMEVVGDRIVLPREAMGFGDVKFMGAIGAFLGWQASVFSLMFSSIIGAAVGLTLIALGKQEWSSRLPYGPYIAVAAVFWIFGGHRLTAWWFGE